MARCINITTGQQISVFNAWAVSTSFYNYIGAVAEGYLTFFNEYDGQMYSVGRGPSALTVSAPDVSIPLGSSLLIQGTVKDISAGTNQATVKANYPNGVPLASDACMGDWMSHVYQQFAAPTNFTGVPVAISVLDSNGNYRTIGTTTSTESGTFSFTWTPDITGDYTVYPTFAGSNGYWGSASQNHFYVGSLQRHHNQHRLHPMVDQYFLPAVIGIIVAVVAVGAVIALLVSKKP